jgi:hypothetical protein
MAAATKKRTPMPRMVDHKCEMCGRPHRVRAVDLARNWGKTCSRVCAAELREKTKREGGNGDVV